MINFVFDEGESKIKQFEYKECTYPECEQRHYPATEEFFYLTKRTNKSKGVHYVLSNWCKKCQVKNAQKNAATKDREERLRYFKTYNKFKRDKEKEKRRLRKRYLRDKDILADRLKSWQKNNKGDIKEHNKKRAEHKKHDVTLLEWTYCLEFFNNSCAYCGLSWEDHMSIFKQDLHKEHVVHDGRNDLKNCVPSCKSCNSEKHEFTLNEWYNIHNPKYDRVRYLRIYQWLRWEVLKFVEPK